MKHLRFKVMDDPEVIAGFGLIQWRSVAYESETQRIHLEGAIVALGFDATTIEEHDSVLVSGNLEVNEGQYLVFEGLTQKEVMELVDSRGRTIQSCYNKMSDSDKSAFDSAFMEGDLMVSVSTEDLDSWDGPSLHL
jgi:hypothetical protein